MFHISELLLKKMQERKDGLEVIFTVLCVIAIVSILLGFPLGVFALECDLPVFHLFNLGNIFLNVLLITFFACMYIVDWIIVLNMNGLILIHTNCTTFCLKRMLQAWYMHTTFLS